LAAIGLELQPGVAMFAQENLARWGLSDRARVEVRDIRDRTPEPAFDLVTLHNNIYYFPVQSRVGVLAHARSFLKPSGRILLTTACQTEDVALAFLNLWAAMTEGCGRAPTVDELVEQLAQAGFSRVRSKSLIPFVGYYSFTGTNPPSVA
jgi:cyclopropane fatty-acyl-phospholipid synthase-like methyltransferase